MRSRPGCLRTVAPSVPTHARVSGATHVVLLGIVLGVSATRSMLGHRRLVQHPDRLTATPSQRLDKGRGSSLTSRWQPARHPPTRVDDRGSTPTCVVTAQDWGRPPTQRHRPRRGRWGRGRHAVGGPALAGRSVYPAPGAATGRYAAKRPVTGDSRPWVDAVSATIRAYSAFPQVNTVLPSVLSAQQEAPGPAAVSPPSALGSTEGFGLGEPVGPGHTCRWATLGDEAHDHGAPVGPLQG